MGAAPPIAPVSSPEGPPVQQQTERQPVTLTPQEQGRQDGPQDAQPLKTSVKSQGRVRTFLQLAIQKVNPMTPERQLRRTDKKIANAHKSIARSEANLNDPAYSSALRGDERNTITSQQAEITRLTARREQLHTEVLTSQQNRTRSTDTQTGSRQTRETRPLEGASPVTTTDNLPNTGKLKTDVQPPTGAAENNTTASTESEAAFLQRQPPREAGAAAYEQWYEEGVQRGFLEPVQETFGEPSRQDQPPDTERPQALPTLQALRGASLEVARRALDQNPGLATEGLVTLDSVRDAGLIQAIREARGDIPGPDEGGQEPPVSQSIKPNAKVAEFANTDTVALPTDRTVALTPERAQRIVEQAQQNAASETTPPAPEATEQAPNPRTSEELWQLDAKTRAGKKTQRAFQDADLARQRLEDPLWEEPRPTEEQVVLAQHRAEEARQRYDAVLQQEAQGIPTSTTDRVITAARRTINRVQTNVQSQREQRQANNRMTQFRDAQQRLIRLTDLSAGAPRHPEREIVTARAERDRLIRQLTPDQVATLDPEERQVLEDLLRADRQREANAARAAEPTQGTEAEAAESATTAGGGKTDEESITPEEENEALRNESAQLKEHARQLVEQEVAALTRVVEPPQADAPIDTTQPADNTLAPQDTPRVERPADEATSPDNNASSQQPETTTSPTPPEIYDSTLVISEEDITGINEEITRRITERKKQVPSTAADHTEAMRQEKFLDHVVTTDVWTEWIRNHRDIAEHIEPGRYPGMDRALATLRASEQKQSTQNAADAKQKHPGDQVESPTELPAEITQPEEEAPETPPEQETQNGEQTGEGKTEDESKTTPEEENRKLREEVAQLKQQVKELVELQAKNLSPEEKKKLLKRIIDALKLLGIEFSKELISLVEGDSPLTK